jgi:histidinol-phosphate aminotransferase
MTPRTDAMSLLDHALSNIKKIAPYQPGKPITEVARELGLPIHSIIKLASNENPLGMSPKARAAVAGAIEGLARYPDDFEFKAALAKHVGVEGNQIVLGNGSNDVLELIAQVFLAPGRSAVYSAHAFAVYPLATLGAGGECIAAAAKEYAHDLSAIRAAVRSDTRIVWIANPNNPTGTFLPYGELKNFILGLPKDVIIVLDEAYNEYLSPELRVDTTMWLAEFDNLVITRTFSKIYGMAGLRIGFALCSPAVADLMNRVRQPFNCNNLALAGAIAALEDSVFIEQSYQLNAAGMQQIVNGLNALALKHLPSHANFVTFCVADAAGVNQRLLKQGVIVRPLAGYDMQDWLRVTIGTETENTRFLEALKVALI